MPERLVSGGGTKISITWGFFFARVGLASAFFVFVKEVKLRQAAIADIASPQRNSFID